MQNARPHFGGEAEEMLRRPLPRCTGARAPVSHWEQQQPHRTGIHCAFVTAAREHLIDQVIAALADLDPVEASAKGLRQYRDRLPEYGRTVLAEKLRRLRELRRV